MVGSQGCWLPSKWSLAFGKPIAFRTSARSGRRHRLGGSDRRDPRLIRTHAFLLPRRRRFFWAARFDNPRCQTELMLQRSIAGVAATLLLVACGGNPIAASGPTAAAIAVQPADLPSDMHKCDLSGDIDSFLNKSKTKDPNTYTSTKTEWDSAKQKGATAAYTAFYTDSTAHCTTIESNSSDISSATYKLVVNFVIQFKDESSASKGYTSESIFGFSASSLKSWRPVVEGTRQG